MHFVFNILHEKTLSVIRETSQAKTHPPRNVKLTFLVASWVWMRPLKRGTSWNHLKPDVTTWNKLEPPVTRWTLQLDDTRNKKFIGETVRAMPLPNGIPYSLAMAIAIKSTILDVYRWNHPEGME